ncbi:uncharacterized protein LOC120282812 [Dioscorea cayenensis subsp. rotundata]|uniref:Uncharacterized protein LOC120282812 n=1 Tax=Dioscorea cayennensis subsp. rotundata TaxID=55577 RepID=A0AB40CZY9_DIOCR|nr:uncharacterized protein LOC120282812 [Dioscorea cayenensis subsp. rotundata]
MKKKMRKSCLDLITSIVPSLIELVGKVPTPSPDNQLKGTISSNRGILVRLVLRSRWNPLATPSLTESSSSLLFLPISLSISRSLGQSSSSLFSLSLSLKTSSSANLIAIERWNPDRWISSLITSLCWRPSCRSLVESSSQILMVLDCNCRKVFEVGLLPERSYQVEESKLGSW